MNDVRCWVALTLARLRTPPILAASAGACLALLAALVAAGDIIVAGAWVRALPPGSATAAVYLRVENHGPATQLVGAEAALAERAELHGHTMDDGVMRMYKLESLDLGMHASETLEPGGTHVMLFGLRESLVEGESFPLTLHFADGARISVEVEIMPLDHEPAHGGGSSKQDHGGHG